MFRFTVYKIKVTVWFTKKKSHVSSSQSLKVWYMKNPESLDANFECSIFRHMGTPDSHRRKDKKVKRG